MERITDPVVSAATAWTRAVQIATGPRIGCDSGRASRPGVAHFQRFRRARHEAALAAGITSPYTLVAVQGYRRRFNPGTVTATGNGTQLASEPASEGDELTEFVMFLFDTVTTGRVASEGLAGSTIEGYANQVVNYYKLAYNEVIERSELCKKVIQRIKSFPREGQFKDPAPASLIMAVLSDTGVSFATRITLMLTWFFTLRLGQVSERDEEKRVWI